MDAWTLTPGCLFSALTRFFLKNIGLTLDLRRSAHPFPPAFATSAGHVFRGCSHSIMFRLPCSLDPQVAPTASSYYDGWPGRLHHATNMRLPAMPCGIATCLNRAIDMSELSSARLQPCRLPPDPDVTVSRHPALIIQSLFLATLPYLLAPPISG